MGKFSMGTGKNFEPLPEDKYQVEVLGAELFMGTKFRSTEEEERLKVTFVVLDKDKTFVEDGVNTPVYGRRLWARTSTMFSPPGSKKPTNITKLVAAVYGHEFETAEADVFDEQDLIGKQLCVMVDAKAGPDGRVWNNILSFSKATKELPKYDELEGKEMVKKSQPAVKANTDDFVKEMDAEAAKKKK